MHAFCTRLFIVSTPPVNNLLLFYQPYITVDYNLTMMLSVQVIFAPVVKTANTPTVNRNPISVCAFQTRHDYNNNSGF